MYITADHFPVTLTINKVQTFLCIVFKKEIQPELDGAGTLLLLSDNRAYI